MPKIDPGRLDAIVAIGEAQDGYFTTDQAGAAGLSLQALVSLEHAGHIEREQYGVYHLARWPSSKRPGLWRAYLWAKRTDPRAAFSHRTALEMHAVSDINPSKIDISFPLGVRVRSAKPPAVVTHRRDLSKDDVVELDGLRVTTLYQTLLDLVTDNISRNAVEDVIERGNSLEITREQAIQLRAIYDLSQETREYLARKLSATHHRSPKR